MNDELVRWNPPGGTGFWEVEEGRAWVELFQPEGSVTLRRPDGSVAVRWPWSPRTRLAAVYLAAEWNAPLEERSIERDVKRGAIRAIPYHLGGERVTQALLSRVAEGMVQLVPAPETAPLALRRIYALPAPMLLDGEGRVWRRDEGLDPYGKQPRWVDVTWKYEPERAPETVR